jgi:hypothetical protein
MNFLTTIACDLHTIAEQTEDQKTKEQLMNLWKNVANYSRAEEALNLGSLHNEQTLIESKNELLKISSSEDLISNIILEQKESNLIEVTTLEMEFLNYLKSCDHSSDGGGIQGYPEFNNPKIERGVLSSLVKKGIVGVDQVQVNFTSDTWVYVNAQYQEKDETDKWCGYKFKNLKLK